MVLSFFSRIFLFYSDNPNLLKVNEIKNIIELAISTEMTNTESQEKINNISEQKRD